jgi:BirA family biotin operon repressor/biotin-[acetyl-CoA-carboxylase] ligase
MDDRELLQRLAAGPATGDALAAAAGLTRAAVWKRIEGLRAAGIEIQGSPGRGYALAWPLELLDPAAIRASMAPAARGLLAGLDVAWTTDSTNTRLLETTTPPEGTQVLLAERQTGGRGRRGRNWASPLAAHLYLSLARHFSGGLTRLGGLSLVAGIAVAEALHALGFEDVRLKWPNDLVVPDCTGLRKLGGLLVEGGGEHAGPVRAVLGIGLNVRMPAAAAAGIDQSWCDLAGLGPAVSRNATAAALLEHLLPALETFDREGLAAFLPRYAALDALAGQHLRLHLPGGECDATALGLADDGALRVRIDDGTERVLHSGEVSVRMDA